MRPHVLEGVGASPARTRISNQAANLHIYNDRIVWASDSFQGGETCRPVYAILLGVNGPLEVSTEHGESLKSYALLVAPWVRRSVHAPQGFFSLNLDPEHPAVSILKPQFLPRQPLIELGHAEDARRLAAQLISQEMDCVAAKTLSESVLRTLFEDMSIPQISQIDDRVLSVMQYLRQQLPQRPGLSALAASVSLSPGRLSHLFREQVGVPMRSYLLWLKMQRAAVLFATDMSIAQVAAEIGFSDAAHLCHVFREYFSVNPSWLADRSRVRVRSCFSSSI